jgi:hypothetical protein
MGQRYPWARYVASIAASMAIAYFPFAADRPVPILDWFDLAVHEAGHLVAAFLPELVMFMAGSFAQIAFPLGMAIYFLARRRDAAAGGFCLAWAGTSAWDVSVYVADAPVQALPLVGGGQHDWAYILGHFDAVDRAGDVANAVEASGAGLAILGVVVAFAAMVRSLQAPKRATVRRRIAPERELQVRTPRTYDPEPDAPRRVPPDPSPAVPPVAGLEEEMPGDPWAAPQAPPPSADWR